MALSFVQHPSAVVTIGGRTVPQDDIDGFSTSGEIGSHSVGWLPVAGGRLSASTGSIRLRGVDCSPWCPTPIVQGETVTIDVSLDGGAPVRVFTGVTDRVSGSASDDVVSVDVVDRIDRFDKAISLPAMLRHWPSLSWGVPVDRHVNLNALYVLDRAVREAGFFATPPLSGDVLLAATCMGSVVPTRGTVRDAVAHTPGTGFSGQAVAFRRTSWGYALGNGVVNYSPNLSLSSGKFDSTIQQVFCLHHDDDRVKTWITNFTLFWGDSHGLQVRVYTGGNIGVRVLSAGTYTEVATLPRSAYGDADTFTVRWDPAGTVTILARGGAAATGSFTVPTHLKNNVVERIRVFVAQGGYAIGGLQAGYSTVNSHNFMRTAIYSPPATEFVQWPALEAFPDLPDKQVRSIIEEYAEATLAGIWLDEDGVFRHRDRVTMASAAPSKVLTSLDDLMSLGWSHQTKSLHSSVTVEGQTPTVTRRQYPSLLLYQGTKETFDEDEEKVDFIEPPAEENWLMVNPPTRAQDMTVSQIRRGRGSVMGGVVIDDDDSESQAWGGNLVQSWAQIKNQKWLLTSTAAVDPGERVEMRLVENPGSYGQYSAEALPLIRGRAKTVWQDIAVTGAHTGPVNAPQYVHQTGPWIQQEPELQGIADWLSEVLTNPEPVLDDVQIVPDPTIRRGDVVWLEDTTRYKIRLKVMVMGTNIAMSAGPPMALTMSISCRVMEAINLSDPTGTWDDADMIWDDAHYQWDGWPAPSFPPPLPQPTPAFLEWDQDTTLWDENLTSWKEN